MEKDKAPKRLREERIINQVSFLVEFLRASLELDKIDAAIGGKRPEGTRTRNHLRQLQQERSSLEFRRSHAYELPSWLKRFDQGISLDENTWGIQERLLSFFRVKPLTAADSERLEALNRVF